ncbi:hypothetical protein FGIG_07481 [Fasciola gigantica]|uniref:Uncharacterized protein n=1 Tax=Fasciola gigantica TaxID=46835 RepID=A0A504YXG0_FASGI|nr:hypothetical protein FGIG_07481 [Fasciola gigantica]
MIQGEISKLTANLAKASGFRRALLLCRRAAFYRKIGRLSSAKEDLEQIKPETEAKFVDYYWQSHLLHVLEGQSKLAEEDLWKCRAELFGVMLFGASSTGWTEKQVTRREQLLQALSRLVQLRGDRRTELTICMNLIELRPRKYAYYYQRGRLYQKVCQLIPALPPRVQQGFDDSNFFFDLLSLGINITNRSYFGRRECKSILNGHRTIYARLVRITD